MPSLFAAILIPYQSQVLTINGQLPVFQVPDTDSYSRTAQVIDAVREQLGIESTVVQVLHGQYNHETERRDALYLMEVHSAFPKSATFLDPAQAQTVTPEQHAAMLQRLNETAIPVLRSAWECPNWYVESKAWAEQFIPIERMTQVRSWALTHMAKIENANGTYYLKATPPQFEREVPVVEFLAQRYPEQSTRLIASDSSRRLLLMADFGGQVLAECPDLDLWDKALAHYGTMQRELSSELDLLASLGCADRRLEQLASRIDEVINDAEFAMPNPRFGLTLEEHQQLIAAIPSLKAMCVELASYAIPYSLEHGDFHAHNIQIVGEQVVFFDWTDACIAHPFFDMAVLLDEYYDVLDMSQAEERLIQAYLSAWSSYESPERLRHAFELARTLGALHQAVSYYDIFANMETAALWQLRGAGGYWLQNLVRRLYPVNQ